MKNILNSKFFHSHKLLVLALSFTLFFSFILNSEIKAQLYGNEWINYNQSYFKIKVYKEGIYRIPYSTLITSGVPVGSFDPRSFQIFNKGVEQYIIVSNENTGTFSTNDYIEFYAKKNDGSFDAALYNVPGTHSNPNYSLFNDTATYFLTWNNTLSNRRMGIETETNFSPYTPLQFFYALNHIDYTNQYFNGETNTFGGTDAEYSLGEGWFDWDISLGGSTTKTIQTPNILATGPAATLKISVFGASMPPHHLRLNFLSYQIDSVFFGCKNLLYTKSIPSNLLGTSIPVTMSSIPDQGSSADKLTIAYLEVKYPQQFNLGNSSAYRMYLPDASAPQLKALINVTNFNVSTSDSALLYDLTNNKKIKVVRNGNTFQALVPNSGGEKLCFITSSGQINNVASLIPVNAEMSNYAKFTNYNSLPYNTSDYLIVTHKKLISEVENYKNYRTFTGYKVLVADVDELYDQFAYGINKHPLSIRNFARFALQNFSDSAKFLFLVGKSLNAVNYRNNASNYANTLVPTIGVPCSDNLFTSRIIDTLYQPAIPTGRLAAQNEAHVSLYLNKVIEYESAQQIAQTAPPLWMKNVLHFGGGSDISQQQQLASYLFQYENIIEDTVFGGYTRTFLKTSSAPIQINQSDSLKDIINNGVSLMTFFGHASGTGFDQSIDNPSEYNNQGKYPFLFANSCYAGDIFSTSQSSSESFVLIPNKGVIGYLASTAPSPIGSLQLYAEWFYKNISYLNYNKPIGKSIQQTVGNLQVASLGNPFIKEVCLVTVLHGDPAISINSFGKPDFEVTSSSIYTTPTFVSTETDSFDVNIISTNKGKAVGGTFVVELKRTYPDGSSVDTYLKQIPATLYKDTITFKLPVSGANGVGINTLQVTLDLYNSFDEITKVNNVVTVNLLIKSTEIIPVYPSKYAVVPNASVILKASTGDPFLGTKNYIFQIDTTDSFNSPFLTIHQTSHAGGLVTWQVPFTLTDSTVYYWRVALDIPQPNWRESSFQYISNKNGWSQAHYFQFKDDAYEYVTYNRSGRDFIFVNDYKVLNAQTGIYPFLPWNEHWFKINGSVLDIWSCLADVGNGLKFAVFDSISGKPWYSHEVGQTGGGQFGNIHCKDYDVPAFDFFTYYPPNSGGWRQKITDFINVIPNGYYVLAYNHKNHYAEDYEEPLYQAFESIGSGSIRILQNNTPYILFGRKGYPISSAHEEIGSSIQQVISLTDSIKTAWNEGYVKSELIGPASKWNSLHWRYEPSSIYQTDSVRLSVIGVKNNGAQDTLMSNIDTDSLDIYNLSASINAQTYPYLYLIAFMRDDSLHTPAQMKRWQVLFDGAPETCLNPSAHYYFHKDTLTQGENMVFSCAIQNIGNYDMDSLLVSYWIVDKDRNVFPIAYPRQKPHSIGDVFIDTIAYSTRNLSGLNSLWVEVNPNFDQIEQYHINNIGEVPFYVLSDKVNPLLDITFDGQHILDGDIVSANPDIQIVLRDENHFLAVNDTTLFKVFLKKPGMTQSEHIYFISNGVENIKFYPATLPENVCRLEYKPGALADGIYELMVQAKDASQNMSGYYDYKITFEIVNKSTITEVMNYPNPFTTSTRFVFTLTGSEVPTYMKIQIMTVTGKIVKEIDMAELGNIHIGRNITQYAWDATDEFGDRLANGVYLYRVIAKMNDNAIELKETAASKYFTHEFGKMYILR